MLRPSLVMTEMISAGAGEEHQRQREDREGRNQGRPLGDTHGWRATRAQGRQSPSALPREEMMGRRRRLLPPTWIPSLAGVGCGGVDGCDFGRQNPSPSPLLDFCIRASGFSLSSAVVGLRLSHFPADRPYHLGRDGLWWAQTATVGPCSFGNTNSQKIKKTSIC